MADIIILKSSAVPGRVPAAKDLQFGELAINTNSGKLFSKRSDRITEEVITFNSNLTTSAKIDKPENTHYLNLDITLRQIKEIKIEVNTQIAFTNHAAANEAITATLFIYNNGDNAISWIDDIIWENGKAPALYSNAWTIIDIISFNAGKKIFGIVKGTNLKEAQ